MNYENDEMLTSPNLSYTSRDYSTIYEELINSIGKLTNEWKPANDSDPGIVLIKLISMLGDMLSYNLDKAALEAFPRTVLQRANAQQIFRLVGYKMHWYRGAQVDIKITNNNSFDLEFDRFCTFSTNGDKIVYTSLTGFRLPSSTYGNTTQTVTLIQGIPVTPKKLVNLTQYTGLNGEWYDSYDYNVDVDDVVNNRIYIKYNNVDETSIVLVDNDEYQFSTNEWTQVENLNLVDDGSKAFEFNVDENNNLYIELPSYWNTKYKISKFKLFFVLSNGRAGEIEENTLININQSYVHCSNSSVSISTALDNVTLMNTASTYGYDPESCTEARINAENYINTINTLVTLPDFERATKRFDSVANAIATDIVTDPHSDEMESNLINLYVVRKNDYNNAGSSYLEAASFEPTDTKLNDQIFKDNIIGELANYKVLTTNINVYLENMIDWIDWTIQGQIYLRHPISSAENQELMNQININLMNRFNCDNLDFNEAINYMDVIECIMKTNKNIWHVDLDDSGIRYERYARNLFGEPTGYVVNNKYEIYIQDEEGNSTYSNYYFTSLGCTSDDLITMREFEDSYDNNFAINNFIPQFLPGSKGSTGLSSVNVNDGDTNYIADGSSKNGYGKNIGNIIVGENGSRYVKNMFGDSGPHEYEIFNKRIYDFTAAKPVFTGYVVNTDDQKNYKIQKYNNIGELEDTNLYISYESHLYLPNGDVSNMYFVYNLSNGREIYHQFDKLCNMDKIIPDQMIAQLSDDEVEALLNSNYIRKAIDIYDIDSLEWTNKSIDLITGEIFEVRGQYSYTVNIKQLDIYGEGEMINYKDVIETPWYDSRGIINKIVIYDKVKSIGAHSFVGCRNVKEVIISNDVENIGHSAFAHCSSINSIKIGKNISVIDVGAFCGCDIKDVYYAGTEEQWLRIQIGELNEGLVNANIHYGNIITTDDIATSSDDILWKISEIDGETYDAYRWYSTNRAYNSETGEICDTLGSLILMGENEPDISLIENKCREDITCEYVHDDFEFNSGQTDFDFYLGQTVNGDPLYDSKGERIVGSPIKPYSVHIYIDGDIETIGDTGTGLLTGTPGLLKGAGSIDYSNGKVHFSLNYSPKTMKVMYKLNKFTYARYKGFDDKLFFVRPEFIRNEIRR